MEGLLLGKGLHVALYITDVVISYWDGDTPGDLPHHR